MAAAIFVRFERPVPGADGADMAGEALARNLEALDRTAGRLGVAPPSALWSLSPDEYEAVIGGQDTDDDMADLPEEVRAEVAELNRQMGEAVAVAREAGPPPEEWFDPADGLATVRALADHVREKPGKFKLPDRLLADLADAERYLGAAADHGTRFHFSSAI